LNVAEAAEVLSLIEEKEPLIHAGFGPNISADQRNNVSVNQRFLLPVKLA
jgi:hypothetical protein